MVINTNIEAQATANNLNASQLNLAKSLARLSSGSKIIVPSDDAAGRAVVVNLGAHDPFSIKKRGHHKASAF